MPTSSEIPVLKGWQKPPTHLYAENYGYAFNFYQPMIDYLDAKDRKIKQKDYPHLPWNNERCLDKYSSKNLVHSYTEDDVHKLAKQAEQQAKQDLQTFKVAKRSDFSLSKSASAASVTKHIKNVTIKKRVKSFDRLDTMEEDSVVFDDLNLTDAHKFAQEYLRGKSAKGIEAHLLADSLKNVSSSTGIDIKAFQRRTELASHDSSEHIRFMEQRERKIKEETAITQPLDELKVELKGFNKKTSQYFEEKSKQTAIEIEQLNARVVEAETKLKTEVTRIKKKLQIQITELEMSLDEIQAHYDEVQRQLQVTLDQYGIAQRKLQSVTAELEEIRGNYEGRTAEQQYEETISRVNELTTINVNLASAKSKVEQELSTLAGDYDEVTRELRAADERYQRVQVELKHTVEILHEEQERIVKIEAIKKSLEIEVKNLSVRLEEVEANAIVGGKRIISKLEARVRDLELELDEEKRRHAETIKILRKKERQVKEVMIQSEEDQKNVSLLQENLDKLVQRVNIYKRQLQEQEGMSQQSVTRVRRFQRELEAAEDRADTAESNLSLIRAKHRTFVTTSTVPGSQVYLVQETHRTTTTSEGI
ncbi:Paramyosin [Blattella germanica]|nr:Paramyosin [Blattella germanica]